MIGACTCRRGVALVAAAMTVLAGTPAQAYLKLGLRDGVNTVSLRWTRLPARYFVNDAGVPGVTADQFRQAADSAFRTWEDVPTAAVRFQFAGFTSAQPLDEDEMSTLGFLSQPELDRVLASTSFLVDTRTGEILESDIFFNSAFQWSVAENGEAGRFDVQSIALHEAGHFLGLSHSALGETEPRAGGGRRVLGAGAVLFPIAFAAGNIAGRTLQPDDIAGVSDIYPGGTFQQDTGSVQGRVTKNGSGIFGVHVVAYDSRTGNLVGNFSLEDTGEFVIAGLAPGVHILRVEPLDDAEVESFFDRTDLDTDFAPGFHDQLVVVPRGGSTERIEIGVRPR
jgi:Matrixin